MRPGRNLREMSVTERTFPPQIDDRGMVRAGGVTLFELRQEGQLVIRDRFPQRLQERGTPDVPVDLVELLAEIIKFYQPT